MDVIKSSQEISTLFAQGKRFHTPYLTLIVLEQEYDRPEKSGGRVAFIAGKKYGNAVWRNSAKRRMRELARAVNAPLLGYDIIFLAKPKILLAQYSVVLKTVQKAVKSIPPKQVQVGQDTSTEVQNG